MASTVITTLSGKEVDFLKPKNICLDDIALGLSRQPRFAGQTQRRYSVAQHCLLVHALYPSLYSLIHDAQEALLCDLPTQLKEALRSLGSTAYDELEDRMYSAICRKLKIPAYNDPEVKKADLRARKIEVDFLRDHKKTKYLDIFLLPGGGYREWLEAVDLYRKPARTAKVYKAGNRTQNDRSVARSAGIVPAPQKSLCVPRQTL